jgi:sugar phosphate isomerase/epimerase
METAAPAADAYTQLKEYVVHFHLKDWHITDTPHPGSTLKRSGKYFSDAVIGEGDMDLKRFWSTVDPAGRELYVNLETMDFSDPSATAAVLKRTARMLQNW